MGCEKKEFHVFRHSSADDIWYILYNKRKNFNDSYKIGQYSSEMKHNF